TELLPVAGAGTELAEAAWLSSLSDGTPEGRSIVTLARERYGVPGRPAPVGAAFVPFSATTRMSGCDVGGRIVRKGAVDAVAAHARLLGGAMPRDVEEAAARIGDTGGTPLAVSDGPRVLGLVHLKDVVKSGIAERFARFRSMGIRTVMITGDNPRTAA